MDTAYFKCEVGSEEVSVKLEEIPAGVKPARMPSSKRMQTFSFRTKNESKKEERRNQVVSSSERLSSDSGKEYSMEEILAREELPIISEENHPAEPEGPSTVSLADNDLSSQRSHDQPSTTLELSVPPPAPPNNLPPQWTVESHEVGPKRRRVPPMRYWCGEKKAMYKDKVVITHFMGE